MEFSKSTKEHLGFYVYSLIDPRDKSIFYVGKASSNNRAFNHLQSKKSETNKQKRIKEIRRAGHEPVVEIIRYGLDSESAAFDVEAAVIDAIGIENLTNVIRGHGVEKGRMLASEIERLYGTSPISVDEITEPCIVFFIHETYSPTLSEQELYDCTRQFWDVGKDERDLLLHRTALAVVEGVIVRVYRIEGWYLQGATLSSRKYKGTRKDKREFVGQIVDNHPLLGLKLVEPSGETIKAMQKGFMYLPRA